MILASSSLSVIINNRRRFIVLLGAAAEYPACWHVVGKGYLTFGGFDTAALFGLVQAYAGLVNEGLRVVRRRRNRVAAKLSSIDLLKIAILSELVERSQERFSDKSSSSIQKKLHL